MLEAFRIFVRERFGLRLNKNQLRYLERLAFEIIKRENVSLPEIIDSLEKNLAGRRYSPQDKFSALRRSLLRRRFPLTRQTQNIRLEKVYSAPVRQPLKDNWIIRRQFRPLAIFVEKKAAGSSIEKKLRRAFPDAGTENIDSYREYIKNNKFTVAQLKKPFLFITDEITDFIKPCPCTKDHLRCGYWIFNLGFGCPFDCSYCYLQEYTNSPGIVLPANIQRFFDGFDAFSERLTDTIRIGTGEFCDSLALDHITGYSAELIPYFKKKNVLFELKTKSANIDNLLKVSPGKNIIISWSLNPQEIISGQEYGAVSLAERIKAAGRVKRSGYGISFHFDPIIHLPGWENLYAEVIAELYSGVRPPFAWISLGTLRCNRKLKSIVEARFPESDIFYGELFLGDDNKLRYPEFIRINIYNKIIETIRKYDKKTPLYLCMENKNVWEKTRGTVSSADIANSLIAPSRKNR